MATTTPQQDGPEPSKSVISWLLVSDPSIRWQVLLDFTDESDEVVASERSRVASEGWGSTLLDLQAPDGQWRGGPQNLPGWSATTDALVLLTDLGLDPASERARSAIALVRDNFTWGPEFGDSRFFEGEVEPCINGRVLAIGAYFGEASDRLADRLLREQLDDGGWNCEAPSSKRSSFHSTICVLEGLLAYEKTKGPTTAVTSARLRGHEYLLERSMFKSLSTGVVIDRDRKTGDRSCWTQFSFPTRWHYDVLRGLDYLRKAGVKPDQRVAEAAELVKKKCDGSGRWPLENPHAGDLSFEMEASAGKPSRWNTLRALRVLDWLT